MAKKRLYCKIANPQHSFVWIDGERREIKIDEMRIYEYLGDLYGMCCVNVELPLKPLKPTRMFAEIAMDKKITTNKDFKLVLFTDDNLAFVFPKVHCYKKNYSLKEGKIKTDKKGEVLDTCMCWVDKQKYLSVYGRP